MERQTKSFPNGVSNRYSFASTRPWRDVSIFADFDTIPPENPLTLRQVKNAKNKKQKKTKGPTTKPSTPFPCLKPKTQKIWPNWYQFCKFLHIFAATETKQCELEPNYLPLISYLGGAARMIKKNCSEVSFVSIKKWKKNNLKSAFENDSIRGKQLSLFYRIPRSLFR